MGQCTSKHGIRKEGAKDLDDAKRNSAVVNQQTSTNPELHSPSSNVKRSQNTNIFMRIILVSFHDFRKFHAPLFSQT